MLFSRLPQGRLRWRQYRQKGRTGKSTVCHDARTAMGWRTIAINWNCSTSRSARAMNSPGCLVILLRSGENGLPRRIVPNSALLRRDAPAVPEGCQDSSKARLRQQGQIWLRWSLKLCCRVAEINCPISRTALSRSPCHSIRIGSSNARVSGH